MAIADRLDVEIIAMDSMTVYRGLDIGSAKPSIEDQAKVRHHLLDLLDPSESASVDWYLRHARTAAADIAGRGKLPLFVGGTPLYLKAALRGLFEGPAADLALRARLENEAKGAGVLELHARLAKVDPRAAIKIQPTDLRRIVRALEVFEKTGTPISEWQRQFDRPADPRPPVACIVQPTAELKRRIDCRVLAMIDAGWIDEVCRLRDRPAPLSREASQAVGYMEIGEFLDGRIDRSTMVARIQARTRQFRKRQMTWFRHIEECRFVETGAHEPFASLAERVAAFFEDAIHRNEREAG